MASGRIALPPKRASKGWRRHVRRAKAAGAKFGDQRRHTYIESSTIEAAMRRFLASVIKREEQEPR